MQLTLVTAPASEPVTLTEICSHLRLIESELDSDSSTDLESDIQSAREHVEDITSRKLFTQTWKYFIDVFPCTNFIKIPFGNLQSITHVKYTDSDGAQTTMTVNAEYIVETNGEQCGRIVLPYSVSWPSFTAYPSNPIEIQFVCGWDDVDDIPAKYKSAIKLICGDLYANRESQVLSSQDYRPNKTVLNLLSSCHLNDTFI